MPKGRQTLFDCWSKCFLLGQEARGARILCSVGLARARLVSHLYSVTQIRLFRSIRKTRLRQAKVLVYDHTAQLQRLAESTWKSSSTASAQDGYLLVPMFAKGTSHDRQSIVPRGQGGGHSICHESWGHCPYPASQKAVEEAQVWDSAVVDLG